MEDSLYLVNMEIEKLESELEEYKRFIITTGEDIDNAKKKRCAILTDGKHDLIDDRDHNTVFYYQEKQMKCRNCSHIELYK